jgi:hypothetical protein
MATQGTAPRDAGAPRALEPGWGDPAVVPLRDSVETEANPKPQVDKRAPARGIALGVALSSLLWAAALYVAFHALR